MKLDVVAILAIVAVSLAGCFATTPLAIVDLQTDKVVVQADEEEATKAVAEKAKEGCALHRRAPRYISSRPHCSGQKCTADPLAGGVKCYQTDCVMHHLYACVR